MSLIHFDAPSPSTQTFVHDIDFAEFRQKYLHSRTFPHQQNLIDVIEGREPSWLHPSMKYEPGLASNRILVNIPPNHAKSMTVTIDYVTWQVCQNPNFRVLIVSQTQQLAADFLYAIKQRLTHAPLIRRSFPKPTLYTTPHASGRRDTMHNDRERQHRGAGR